MPTSVLQHLQYLGHLDLFHLAILGSANIPTSSYIDLYMDGSSTPPALFPHRLAQAPRPRRSGPPRVSGYVA